MFMRDSHVRLIKGRVAIAAHADAGLAGAGDTRMTAAVREELLEQRRRANGMCATASEEAMRFPAGGR
jgi:hypothetical protein